MLRMKTTKTILAGFLVMLFIVGMLMPLAQAQVQITGELLRKTGTGVAAWTTEQAYNGSYSVKLVIATSGDGAKVMLPYGDTIDTITSDAKDQLNFYAYRVSGSESWPYLYLEMDFDDDGVADHWLVSVPWWEGMELPTPEWPPFDTWFKAYAKPKPVYGGGWALYPSDGYSPGYEDFVTYWKVELAGKTVLYVTVGVGYDGFVGIFYVDTVTINAVSYDLEPDPITLYPTSGPPGTSVEVMAGAGSFDVGEIVNIYFAASLVGSTTADGNGAIYKEVTVPDVVAGTYTVTAVGLTSGNVYTATFTVPSPTLTLTPSSGVPETSVTINGNYFKIGGPQNVTLYFAGVQWGDVVLYNALNATGGFTGVTRTVPVNPPGNYTVSATDGINTATATFTIPSLSITVDPDWGPPGKPGIAVSGTGFTKNGLVRIYLTQPL